MEEARVIFNTDATVDPVIVRGEKGVRIQGFFLKKFNDEIRLNLFPDHQFEIDSFRKLLKFEKGKLWLRPNEAIEADITSFDIYDETQIYRKLNIPSIIKDMRPVYLNYSCDWSESDADILLILENAARSIQLSYKWNNLEKRELIENEPIYVDIYPERAIHFVSAGEVYYFTVVLRFMHIEPAETKLKIVYSKNSLIIERNNKSLKVCKFCIFLHPNPIERLFHGIRTASFASSKVVFAINHFAFARLFQWFSCAITDKIQIPLANPPKQMPRQVAPNLTLFDHSGRGWFVPSTNLGNRLIINANIVFMVGDVDEKFFAGVVKSGKYKAVGLITEDKNSLYKALLPFSSKKLSIKNNKDIWKSYKKTKVVGLYSPYFIKSRVKIENLIIKVIERTKPTYTEFTDRIWKYHIRKRLEPLPFCSDLAIGIISNFGNILRGRFPDDNGSDVVDYKKFFRDDLWLTKWSNVITMDRSELIAELNVRIISEYTAVRAYLELCDYELCTKKSTKKDLNKLIYEFEEPLYNWEKWGSANANERNETRQKINHLITSNKLKEEEVLKIFATIFHENSSLLLPTTKRTRRKEYLSLVNSFVIIYATGGRDKLNVKLEHLGGEFDLNLAASSGFWASFASQLSALKSSAIIPNLIPHETILDALKMQTLLRLKIHSLERKDKELTEIMEIREKLGKFLLDTIETDLKKLLDNLGADRIIAFSNLYLDFIPYNETILGLDIPIIRYPVDIEASIIFNHAIAGSHHVLSFEKSNEVAILCEPKVSGKVSEWSNDIANSLIDAFKLIGMSTEFPLKTSNDINMIIDKALESEIIVFIGHAAASQHWAGLSIDKKWLSIKDISKYDWSDKLIFLIGCETAALDTKHGDIGNEFFLKGARAVIATTAKVSVDVSQVFFNEIILRLLRGMPLDYAFFIARKKTFIYEVLKDKDQEITLDKFEEIFDPKKSVVEILRSNKIKWPEAFKCSPYSLAFTLLGGIGQTIV